MVDDKQLPDLSDAEWIVMKQVWQLKKTNVREVYEALAPAQRWAYNTVRTMMERLREKGYLAGKKVGNMMFYTPQVPRRRIVRGAMRSFAEKVLDGTIGSLVSYLIKEENLSPAEIEEIKALLEEKGGPEDEKSEK